MLSRQLAERGQYPAIDVEASISRVMPQVTSTEQLQSAKTLRRYYSLYEQNVDLFNVGAYQRGANPELDRAVALRPAMERFLAQGMNEAVDFGQAVAGLQDVVAPAEADART